MIPKPNSEWPPAEYATILNPIRSWATWYEGDTEKLAALYGAITAQNVRPSLQASGVVGRVARWFWGQPVPAGQSKAKSHIPIARDIARVSSRLLFGETLEAKIADDEKATARLIEILKGNRWEQLLPEAGEFCSGLGGVYLRCGWDQTVALHPLISIVQPDAAIPTFRWGRLVEVTFWQIVRREGASVWRHLETHKPGAVEHQLWQGTTSNLGSLVPLEESTQTAGLPVDDKSQIPTGTNRLTATYVPNLKPVPMWRNDPIGQHLGCADFDGIESRMDELDEAWTNLRREGRLNKTRIIAASALLTSFGAGMGASFDSDREVFVPVDGPSDMPSLPITVAASTLSVRDRLDAIAELVRSIYSDAGYSPSTFGLNDGGTAVTATEIASRDRKTMSTRETKTRYWTTALEDFLETVMAIDAAVWPNLGHQGRPSVTFPAAVSPTIREVAEVAQLLNTALAASVETRVKMVHPEWDDTLISEEVARIMAENAMTAPTFTADPQIDPNTPTAAADLPGGGS